MSSRTVKWQPAVTWQGQVACHRLVYQFSLLSCMQLCKITGRNPQGLISNWWKCENPVFSLHAWCGLIEWNAYLEYNFLRTEELVVVALNIVRLTNKYYMVHVIRVTCDIQILIGAPSGGLPLDFATPSNVDRWRFWHRSSMNFETWAELINRSTNFTIATISNYATAFRRDSCPQACVIS